MYIDLSQECVVDTKDVIGIFDLDNTTTNRFTTDFLNRLRSENKVKYLVSDIPKSFILMADGTVYICELSARILRKRMDILKGGKNVRN